MWFYKEASDFACFALLQYTRGGPNPTLEIRDLDLFGYLGSGRWDLDLLVNDPDPGEDPDPHEDPDPFWGLFP